MRYAIFTLLALMCLLSACGQPRPMTFEEQQLYMARQQCEQEATDFNPENPWGANPFWSSYFVMCMHNMGFTNEELNRLWY